MGFKVEYIDRRGDEVVITVSDTTAIPTMSLCGSGDPLTIKWKGEGIIQPSSAQLNILLKTETERNEVVKIFNGNHFMTVEVAGSTEWIGKVTPTFSREQYKNFPYVLSINAQDALAGLQKSEPLMIDFPYPHDKESPQVNLSIILFKLFTDGRVMGGSTPYFKIPTYINFASKVYKDVLNTILEEVYVDMRVFMKEDVNDNFYDNWLEILEQLLNPFNLKMFQWKGEWWIIARDEMTNYGMIYYRKYEIDPPNDPLVVIGDYTLDQGIRLLYDCTKWGKDFTQVGDDAEMSYMSPSAGYELTQEFQKNEQILPVIANRQGDNFYGHNNQQLEFNTNGNVLLHWDLYGDDNLLVGELERNDGWTRIRTRAEYAPMHDYLSKTVSLPPAEDYQGFSIDASTFCNHSTAKDVRFRMNIIYNYGGEDYYYWINDDGDAEWNNEFRTLQVSVGNISIDNTLLPDNYGDGATLTINIREGVTKNVINHDAYYIAYKGLQVSLVNVYYEKSDYTQIEERVILSTVYDKKEEAKWQWGITHPSLSNDNALHYSSPYDVNGDAIVNWTKLGHEDEWDRPLSEWWLDYFVSNRIGYSQQLSTTFIDDAISPIRLFKDADGAFYDTGAMTYKQKKNEWSVDLNQYKNVYEGVPTNTGDFSPWDFNVDFWTQT